jgi:hypothetical protein
MEKQRSSGNVVMIPKEVLARLKNLEKLYPTKVALAKALETDYQKLRYMREHKTCLSSSLDNLMLNLTNVEQLNNN